MNWWFLAKCFFIGVSASSTMGPIFVMTFNYSALRGFWKGFFISLGAAIGDGILIFLGMMGVLTFLQKSQAYQLSIDLAGGTLLLIFGLLMIFRPQQIQQEDNRLKANTLLLGMTKALVSTVVNPLAILFFMFAGAQIIPAGRALQAYDIALGSITTALGSLFILVIVAWVATNVGKVIKQHHLYYISLITGGIIVSVGAYFMYDAVLITLRWILN